MRKRACTSSIVLCGSGFTDERNSIASCRKRAPADHRQLELSHFCALRWPPPTHTATAEQASAQSSDQVGQLHRKTRGAARWGGTTCREGLRRRSGKAALAKDIAIFFFTHCYEWPLFITPLPLFVSCVRACTKCGECLGTAFGLRPRRGLDIAADRRNAPWRHSDMK